MTYGTSSPSGLEFLHQPPDQWPTMPVASEAEPDLVEPRKSIFIGITSEAQTTDLPDPTQFHTWKDLVRITVTSFMGRLPPATVRLQIQPPSSQQRSYSLIRTLFWVSQWPSRPVDPLKLTVVRLHSQLKMTIPQDYFMLEGYLQPAKDLEADAIHLIFLDQTTELLIQDFDHRLLHPGPGQVLAKMLARRCLGGKTGHDYAACSTNGTSWVQTPPGGLVLGAHRLKSTALVQRDCSWRFLSKSGHAWPQAERYSNSKSDNQ